MPYDFGMLFEKIFCLTEKHLLPFRQIQNLMNLMKHAGQIVGYHHDGQPQLVNASFQHGIHLFRDARIQPGHRFIQYQHLTACRQCPRQKHSLLLSARQFAECMILQRGKG